jgi:hypothetical protein
VEVIDGWMDGLKSVNQTNKKEERNFRFGRVWHGITGMSELCRTRPDRTEHELPWLGVKTMRPGTENDDYTSTCTAHFAYDDDDDDQKMDSHSPTDGDVNGKEGSADPFIEFDRLTETTRIKRLN